MRIADSVIVITGGGSGIGAGLARRFVAEGAQALVVADYRIEGASAVADELGTGSAPSRWTSRTRPRSPTWSPGR